MGKKAEEMSPERGSLGRGVTLIIYMLTALYSLPPPFSSLSHLSPPLPMPLAICRAGVIMAPSYNRGNGPLSGSVA